VIIGPESSGRVDAGSSGEQPERVKDSPTVSRAALRQQWLERVDATIRAYGLQQAAPLALQAIEDGVEHPSLLNLAASARHREGRFEDAVHLLKHARSLAPKDPNILNSLGICLKALGRTDAALEAYAAALKIDPAMAPAHFNRGAILESLNDVTGARSAYERAANLDPNYVEPLASLAWLDAQAGDPISARSNAERVLALSRSNVLARMALAAADLQDRDLAAATSGLRALAHDPAVTQVNHSIVIGLIGDLLDAEGRPADAFAAYATSNAELKTLHAAAYELNGGETPLGHARRLAKWFVTADPEPWREAPLLRQRAADPRTHVFLVGFPRSGTTLLENVLAAHPDVVSLEEKDSLATASAPYLESDEGLQRLARLTSGEAARHRDAYWSFVRSFGVEPRGKVFIDKMPLASVALPMVAKLFPNARILFARRDPRDVVLSCFRRRFGMNPSMYQLLTLDGAAAYYDAVMRLSEIYRGILPLPQHVVRYESLIEDFEGTARAACEFLGVDWNARLLDFASRARKRGISTPSAAQVTRGLNREGQGVWRRYADQMAAVLPVVDPWVRGFGYEL
jgi:tetratricopeptide (TPR) repeat protein